MEREKGNYRLTLLSDYTVVDIETTGLDPRYDSIIEMAALKVKNGEICGSYSTLVNPGHPIDPFVTELTHITNEMLKNAPSIRDVIGQFCDFIGDDVVIGHNVNFDLNFLYDNAVQATGKKLQNDYGDTMYISRRLHSDLEHHRLQDLVKLYGIQQDAFHRALDDCISTQLVYKCEMDEMQERGITEFKRASHSGRHLSAKDILATTDLDPDSPVYKKVFVFTGALERMVRKDAMQIVVNLGGECGDGVTKKTNFLVLGNNDYCSSIKDGKSTKQKKAEKLVLDGADLTIISEDVFYEMIGQ